jgi:hypothetical protein
MYTIGGKSFSELGVERAVLTQGLSSESSLTLDFSAPYDAGKEFNPFQSYTLSGEGLDWVLGWVGWLNYEGISASNSGEYRSLSFFGPLRFLDYAVFGQEYYPNPSQVKNWEGYRVENQSTVALGRKFVVARDANPTWNVTPNDSVSDLNEEKISANEQLKELIKEFNKLEHIPVSLEGGLPELKLPYLIRDNATYGSCIFALLAWFPEYGIVEDGFKLIIRKIGSKSWNTPKAIENFSANPRYDLLVRKVKLVYIPHESQGRGLENRLSEINAGARIDEASSGRGFKDIVETYHLQDGESFPDMGLASRYMDWVGRLKVDSSFTLMGDILPSWNPGDGIDLSPFYSGEGETQIMTISRDLSQDSISISAGSKAHLGLDQLFDLNRRSTPSPPVQPSNSNGGGGPGSNPRGFLTVDIQIPKELPNLSNEERQRFLRSVRWQIVHGDNGSVLRTLTSNRRRIPLFVGSYTIIFDDPFSFTKGNDVYIFTVDTQDGVPEVDVNISSNSENEVRIRFKLLEVQSLEPNTYPFQAVLKNTGTAESPAWKVHVLHGKLYHSLRPNHFHDSIVKLCPPNPSESQIASNQIDVNSSDAIYLEIEFQTASPFGIEKAEIKTLGSGGSFSPSANAWTTDSFVEDDGATAPTPKRLKYVRKIIAYTIAGDGGEPVLYQSVRSDQLIKDACINGRPARYPVAHEGGYV